MAFTGKLEKKNATTSASSGSGGEGSGIDFLLVSFHQQNLNSIFKPTNSSHILTKVHSTISICVVLIFVTLLLFTVSSFEPNNDLTSFHHHRHRSNSHGQNPRALQRLGTLYIRGTTSMNNLVLSHVTNSVTTKQLISFLRAFHRSDLASNSDLLFIFDSITAPKYLHNMITKENELFLRIISQYKRELCNASNDADFRISFDPTRFVKSGKKVVKKRESIWGGGMKSDNDGTELTRTSYGSVVGFGVGELDPENSLSGFMDHVPFSLRRWACYPMILGRVRRYYKHVGLIDVENVLLLGDPLGQVDNPSPDSVYLLSTNKKTIDLAVIMGGIRGVRRLSASMLTEIVRATVKQKNNNKWKNLVTETSLLTRIVTSEFILKSVHIVILGESTREASSLRGFWRGNETIVWRENIDIDIDSVIMKYICSFPIDSTVYTDC